MTLNIELAGHKILVIDDDDTSRRLARMVLERNGILVEVACCGQEALDMLSSCQPDLILLDIMMPGLDGYATCAEIKKLPDCQDIPVIFLTTRMETASIVKALSQDGADYITKPFRPAEALARIKVHLQASFLMKRHLDDIEALQKANKEKSRLMGIVSHDLKNPLISIRGLSEFLADEMPGPLNQDQATMIQSVLSASGNMLSLVDDLLDYSLTEHRDERNELAPGSLAEVVRNSTNLLRFNASRKNINIKIKNGDLKTNILFDQRQIRRVIDNLVSNAIKFSPPQTNVEINLLNGGDTVRCEVSDEGPGIPESEREKIFKAFGTTSVKPTGGEMSTGLGLSICKKIIEAHGGSISFRNRLEGGCLFAFSLPIMAPVKEEEVALAGC